MKVVAVRVNAYHVLEVISYFPSEKLKMPGRYLCSGMEEWLGCNWTLAKDSITGLLEF